MEKTITHDYEMLVELNQMTNSRWEYNIWKIVYQAYSNYHSSQKAHELLLNLFLYPHIFSNVISFTIVVYTFVLHFLVLNKAHH